MKIVRASSNHSSEILIYNRVPFRFVASLFGGWNCGTPVRHEHKRVQRDRPCAGAAGLMTSPQACWAVLGGHTCTWCANILPSSLCFANISSFIHAKAYR